MINEGLSKEIHNDLIEFISGMKQRYQIATRSVSVDAEPNPDQTEVMVDFTWSFTIPVPE